MSWIAHPTELAGRNSRLVPLHPGHFEAICKLGEAEEIWTYSPVGVYGADREKLLGFLERCIREREAGQWYPFVVMLKDGTITGCTQYHNISQEHRHLEIGATWLHPAYWSKGINTEIKYLMLQHCFETLGTVRVQIKTSDTNARSRRAIEKIGAKAEGILRKDKMLEDGTLRNAAYYSVIESEWPEVKKKLEQLLHLTHNDNIR